jgi:hypothetical protein
MSDKTRTAYFFSRLRRQFYGCSRLRKRIIVSVAALVILATGSAIADIYLPNLFPFLAPPVPST